ncbi:serine/threonine-protein phosphatase 6 regulatory ankyrin repeat subunit B [Aspergillus udagawae]|nr:serine/threonine-protein phosphatase 6 regulatory ankyrin repeat subunit B [Aspergillus udagawae]
MDISSSQSSSFIWQALVRATTEFNLCPNRVWAVARSLPQREKNIPLLILTSDADIKHRIPHHPGHEQCTFDFCEFSRRDFTGVQQRHETPGCTCVPLRGLFPPDELEKAAKAGKVTAWALDGKSIIRPPRPFMAISHVWADGTGAGAWGPGQVNRCLHSFFRRIAKQFQCEGIWWDTVCIPRSKAARTVAINRMQQNYEDARVTLVHDCFLREWEWIDDDDDSKNARLACFAIIMSPWFSRGWTALELARSRRVKVIFKGAYGPAIKDLDDDILAKVPDDIIARPIANLRATRISAVDDLLTVLGSRYTSWPRDIATIAGLLVGINIPHDATQQDIYQRILKRVGKVSPEHLFHNSATMSKGGFTWCPTSLVDLAPSSGLTSLRVTEDGAVMGQWRVLGRPDWISRGRYNWKGTHPLAEVRLQAALQRPETHCLLAEVDCEAISRAVLVEVVNKTKDSECECGRFIGSVYFHPPLQRQEMSHPDELLTPKEVVIGVADDNAESKSVRTRSTSNIPIHHSSDSDLGEQLISSAASGDALEVERLLGTEVDPNFSDKITTWTALHYATWGNHDEVVRSLVEKSDLNLGDRLGQKAIHLAAERGNERILRQLLEQGVEVNSRCADEQRVLHRAAFVGSEPVVELLLRTPGVKVNAQDSLKRTALHLAAQHGHKGAVKQLLSSDRVDLSLAESAGKTPLHLAAEYGNEAIVELLMPRTDCDQQDAVGQTALHLAAARGYSTIVRLLLETSTPNLQDVMGRTALHLAILEKKNETAVLLAAFDLNCADLVGKTAFHLAAQHGCKDVVDVLTKKLDPNLPDITGRTALHMASENGHVSIVKSLLPKATLGLQDSAGQTALHLAIQNEHEDIARLLIGSTPDTPDDFGKTALHLASEKGYTSLVELLMERGNPNAEDSQGLTALDMAKKGAHGHVAALLEKACPRESMTSPSGPLKRGYASIIQRLLETINPDIRHSNSETALQLAVQNRIRDVTMLLLENWKELPVYHRPSLRPTVTREESKVVIELLMEKGADIGAKNNVGFTVLDYAALGGHEAVVRLLIEKGEKLGEPTLHFAVLGGNEAVVELILENGGDISASYPFFYNEVLYRIGLKENEHYDIREDHWINPALKFAAFTGNGPMIRLFKQYGVEDSGNILEWARLTTNKSTLQHFLETWADQLDYWDIKNSMCAAAERCSESTMRMLIEKGGDPLLEDSGANLLHYAAMGGNEAVFQLLMEKGADIWARDEHGATVLHAAVMGGNEEVVRLLIERGLDISAEVESWSLFCGDMGGTVLDLALCNGSASLVRLFVDMGVDVFQRGTIGTLFIATGDKARLQFLLEKVPDIFAKNDHRVSVAHFAAIAGNETIIPRLLEQGIDISTQDGEGETVLSLAIREGNNAAAWLLIAKDIGILAKTDDGVTPLHLAAQKGNRGMVELLLRKGVDISSTSKDGLTVLHYAAEGGNEAVIQLLIEESSGLDLLSAKSSDGVTPLHLAAKTGNKGAVRLLIEKGADIFSMSDNGMTVPHYAAEAEGPTVLQMFVENWEHYFSEHDKAWKGVGVLEA